MDFSNYLKLINNCDEHAPLLSDTSLGQCLCFVPLRHVPPSDLIQTSQSLNVEQLIRTQDGLARDFRGLAELLGFSTTELEAHFKRSNNPTKCLLDSYIDMKNLNQSTNGGNTSPMFSVTDLIKLIEKLERFDVLDDLLPTLVRLANESQSNHIKGNRQQQQQALESNGKLKTDLNESNSLISVHHHNHISSAGNNTHSQSVPATAVQQFDAFVCYAPEDYDYAMGLINLLERNNKRIITPDNLLAGQLKYNALVQMIAEECKRVILILTPNFLRSKDCDFQAKFAYEIAIQSAQFPKVIPILYEPIDENQLPCLLRVISKIDMTHRNANQHQWQLRKVLGSLNQANDSTQGQQHNQSVTYYEDSSRSNMIAHHNPLKITLNGSQTTNESRAAILLQQQPLDHLTTISTASSINQPEHHNVNYRSDNLLSPEPIIDLAHSQSSRSELSIASTSISICSPTTTSSFLISTELPSSPTPPLSNLASSSSSQNPLINLYRSFKRKVSGNSERAISPSMSSRANLLSSPDNLSK